MFSKIILTGAGGVAGGISVFYGISRLNGSPQSTWDSNWDKRDPTSLIKMSKPGDPEKLQKYNEEIKNKKPKATRHVILIRHGQYNLSGKTDEERYLTSLGEKQAITTGQRLKELDFPYNKIIRSTMTRATQTAKLIEKFFPGIPVVDSQLLEEGAPVMPEPKHSTWKPELFYYQDGARIEAAFRKFIHRAPPEQERDSYDIIVCHANVIRYMVCRALQLPPNAWLRFSLKHASITWLSIPPSGNVSLREYGGAEHMPKGLMTTT